MESIQKEDQKVQYVLQHGKHTIHWITAKPLSDQEQAARGLFQELLQAASQPKHSSGNACVKLCYFIEQCSKSKSLILQNVAYSYGTCLSLFLFYVEGNDRNQHRSMKQVLELLASLINCNSNASTAQGVKREILYRLVSNITHGSAQSYVKPSLKVLEYFLSRNTISVKELLAVHSESAFFKETRRPYGQKFAQSKLSDSFVSATFYWMSLPDTAPGAGKLFVTFLQVLREDHLGNVLDDCNVYTPVWERWIRSGLVEHPECLENVKNFLFLPLFKLDREASLSFLQNLAQKADFKRLENNELDAQAFLLLSAMEAGKKSGLVDEFSVSPQNGSTKVRNFILLPEDVIGTLLNHTLSRVRSAAFSVLVSSISSTRPFPVRTLVILKQKLAVLHADTDAKFRNEVLSNSKRMVERLRGAIYSLTRDIAVANSSVQKFSDVEDTNPQSAKNIKYLLEISLQEHKDFMKWYLQFLSNELISTASYQRHITALRAIQIVIKLGALGSQMDSGSMISPNAQSVWTFDISCFSKTLVRLLLDRIIDPFEDVRVAAMDILKSASLGNFLDLKHYRFFILSSDKSVLELESRDASNCSQPSHQEGNNIAYAEESWSHAVPIFLIKFREIIDTASQRTGRADVADGVARTSELFCTFLLTDVLRLNFLEYLVDGLEEKVTVAEDDISKAVMAAPIHGQFASLRLVWDLLSQPLSQTIMPANQSKIPEDVSLRLPNRKTAWESIQYRMIRCCARIWSVVEDVLCNDSPEGHLPNDLDDFDTLDTKDILSYSFRAVYESSNLLATIVSKIRLRFADGSPILPFRAFQEAGDLTFQQLANLRHRGAFSAVSLTFAKCCQLTQDTSLEGLDGMNLLSKWYQGALNCIQNQVSTTRRSAGIPALITGILSADSSFPAFEEVMSELKVIARQPVQLSDKDETSLPQVHAINCLKEVFKSSSIGKRSEHHIPDCLQLAATSLKSKTWAIRNCGLLLLRSLIDCLFGTSESKLITESGWDGRSIRLAYGSYPVLPQLLLDLMMPSLEKQAIARTSDIGAFESVFPALDIIRRAGPPRLLKEEIFYSVKTHLGSTMWHVRDIAARTMCTLLLHDRWLQELINLLNTCSTLSNEIHGVLITTKYLLERKYEVNPVSVSENLLALAEEIKNFWEMKAFYGMNTILEAAYEELATSVLRILFIEKSTRTSQIPEISSKRIVFLDEGVFNRVSQRLRRSSKNMLTDKSTDRNDMIANDMSSALTISALTLRAIYTAAIDSQMDKLKDLVKVAIQHDTDIACTMLDRMAVLWDKQTSVNILLDLFDIYQRVLSTTSDSHIRSSALHNLATLLDYFSEHDFLSKISLNHDLLGFSVSLLMSESRSLSTTVIKVTGSLLSYHLVSQSQSNESDMLSEQLKKQIRAWGNMLSDVGKSENDFDIRFAAVQALDNFWQGSWKEKSAFQSNEFLLPSLLALYDTLNDDDDEIREVGARVVSTIVGTSLVPLAASNEFLDWLHTAFGENENYSRVVAQRIAGCYSTKSHVSLPVEKQLADAMEQDSSLFVEEEQNLYIDEVRETTIWTSLLVKSKGPHWDKILGQLSSWAINGLDTLNRLANTEDGPLGWTSIPKVFAICMKIILTAKAILARYSSSSFFTEHNTVKNGSNDTTDKHINNVTQQLCLAMSRLHDIGCTTNLHPLLLGHLENS